jgi:hypothetical protein
MSQTVTREGRLKLPACGLFKTTRALPGAEQAVPAGLLVNFHNHSEQNMPVVHVPVHNVFNRWQWSATPNYVRQLSWIESLQRLPIEGFYVLRRDVLLDDGKNRWPKGTLVQLGYDRTANPIVFIAQQRHELHENSLVFADSGVAIGAEGLDHIEPLMVYEEPDPNAAAGGSHK